MISTLIDPHLPFISDRLQIAVNWSIGTRVPVCALLMNAVKSCSNNIPPGRNAVNLPKAPVANHKRPLMA